MCVTKAITEAEASRRGLLGLGAAGGPPPEIDRAGIASALVVGDRIYTVDCGRGSVTQYAQARLAHKNLKAMFISHLHADHLMDFYGFVSGPGPAA